VRSASVRLYWISVVSNVLALAVLLHGILGPSKRQEQVLAVMLTSVSMLCWLAYFRKLNK
jgi:hypothetical protein